VSRLKKIIAMVLLALWAPITSHCLLEVADLIPDALHCADACVPGNGDCSDEADACSSLESASYRMDDECPAIVVPLSATLIRAGEPLCSLQCSYASFSVAPFELTVTWQFSCRTALLPRAPSFVS
jgi:hypothetical protein